MDEIDIQILRILQENSKTPHYQIGKKLKIGTSTVHYRVQKLIGDGTIQYFSAIIDPVKVGYETAAVIGLSVNPKKLYKIAKKLASFNEVHVVAVTQGDHDLIVQILEKNEKELWHFINKNIKTIDGIEKGFDVSTFITIEKKTHKIRL